MGSIRALTPFAAMAIAALAVAAGTTGCAKQPAAEAPTNVAVSPPTVPSGVSFRATLDGPLSSLHASVGDRITATIDEPLRGTDGAIVVSKGSKVHGRILDVGREGVNRLVIQFDTLEVDGRNLQVSAQVTRIESAQVVTSNAPDASALSVDVYPILPRADAPAVGGGPASLQLPVELNAGTGIQLYLSRPFVVMPREPNAM